CGCRPRASGDPDSRGQRVRHDGPRLRGDDIGACGRTSSVTPLSRGRVFPRQLRRRYGFRALVGHLQPRLPPPCTLERVTYGNAQPAEPLALELDYIAVLKRAQTSVIGAGRQHVAGLERVNRADPFDAAWDLVGHVAGVEILLDYAVDREPHLQPMRVGN